MFRSAPPWGSQVYVQAHHILPSCCSPLPQDDPDAQPAFNSASLTLQAGQSCQKGDLSSQKSIHLAGFPAWVPLALWRQSLLPGEQQSHLKIRMTVVMTSSALPSTCSYIVAETANIVGLRADIKEHTSSSKSIGSNRELKRFTGRPLRSTRNFT